MRLADRIIEFHQSLAAHGVPHAFGGALALAWCTERARGTIDIDVNVFVEPTDLDRLIRAIPTGVGVRASNLSDLERDGQSRLWWESTPVDIFMNTTAFHQAVADRIRWERFGGELLPFLSCDDLAVFKSFFNRTKDWADLEAMASAGSLDVERVVEVLSDYLGSDDDRIVRLRSLDTM